MKYSVKILSLLLSVYFIQSCTISPFSDVVLSVDRYEFIFTGYVIDKQLIIDNYPEGIGYQLLIPKHSRFIEIDNDNYWYSVVISRDYNMIYVKLNYNALEYRLEKSPIEQFNGRFTISYKDQVIPISVRLDIDY